MHLSNLTVEQAALGDRAGERTLYVPRDNYIGMTSFTPCKNPQGHHEMEVVTYTLDDFLRRHALSNADFIKCDVEGHELDVLEGAKETLQRRRPILLLECEDFRNGGGQLERVKSFLSRFDYTCLALGEQGIRPYDECAQEMQTSGRRMGLDAWRNFGFVPLERAA